MRPLVLVLLLAGCSNAPRPVSQTLPRDLSSLGRLVAEHFNEVNGVPIEVDPEFACSLEEPACASLDAGPIVTGFAQARGVPVVAREGREDQPKCHWSGVVDQVTGLRVSFSPPQFEEDSARVMVRRTCDGRPAGRGFLHASEFIFSRSPGEGWVFDSIGLTIIS